MSLVVNPDGSLSYVRVVPIDPSKPPMTSIDCILLNPRCAISPFRKDDPMKYCPMWKGRRRFVRASSALERYRYSSLQTRVLSMRKPPIKRKNRDNDDDNDDDDDLSEQQGANTTIIKPSEKKPRLYRYQRTYGAFPVVDDSQPLLLPKPLATLPIRPQCSKYRVARRGFPTTRQNNTNRTRLPCPIKFYIHEEAVPATQSRSVPELCRNTYQYFHREHESRGDVQVQECGTHQNMHSTNACAVIATAIAAYHLKPEVPPTIEQIIDGSGAIAIEIRRNHWQGGNSLLEQVQVAIRAISSTR